MRVVFGFLGALLVLQVHGQDARILAAGELGVREVTASLEAYSAGADAANLEAVVANADRFVALPEPDVHFGYTGGVHWFRFQVHNAGDAGVYLMRLNNAQLSSVTLCTPTGNGAFRIQSAGVDVPFADRPIPSLTPSFRLELDARADNTCYLRVEHYGALRFRATVLPEQVGYWHNSLEIALNALLAGALLGLAMYNGCVFIGLREATYLWISLMLLGLALNQTTFSGLANLLFWSGPGKWADHAFTLTGVLVIGCGIAATMSFVRAWENSPHLARFAVGWIILGTGTGFASLAGNPAVFYAVVAYLLGTPALVAAMGFRAVRRPSATVMLFFGSWGVMMIGCVLFGLAYLNVLPANALTLNFMYGGALAAAVAWSFALTRQVRSQAHRREARLEHKVAVRTVQLESALGDMQILRGLLPVCRVCRRIRDDDGRWHAFESYARSAVVGVEICPDCARASGAQGDSWNTDR